MIRLVQSNYMRKESQTLCFQTSKCYFLYVSTQHSFSDHSICASDNTSSYDWILYYTWFRYVTFNKIKISITSSKVISSFARPFPCTTSGISQSFNKTHYLLCKRNTESLLHKPEPKRSSAPFVPADGHRTHFQQGTSMHTYNH